MRRLRIRSYSLLALTLLLLLPWICFVGAHFLTNHTLELGSDQSNSYAVPMVAAFAGLLLAFFLVGIYMRKLLLTPLEQMSQASRQIAEGDWDVQLPQSPIREMTEVRDGFAAMVQGLRHSHLQQARLEEERRFFIAAIAHDLRTPLFALRGYLDGLEQGIARSPDQVSKYVAVCKEKSEQLDRLVEDLFTFTKMEYMRTGPSENLTDLHDIIQKSISSLEQQAQQKHISIVAQYASDACVIRGDSHLLERAVSNLLDNAVRHTPEHGRIMVQCNREQDRATFTIRDSGSGFSHAELQRIFEPLYRGEQSRNRATGGAGLGLAISQRIMRLHGGELAAGNHADGGAMLSGWLPAAPPTYMREQGGWLR